MRVEYPMHHHSLLGQTWGRVDFRSSVDAARHDAAEKAGAGQHGWD